MTAVEDTDSMSSSPGSTRLLVGCQRVDEVDLAADLTLRTSFVIGPPELLDFRSLKSLNSPIIAMKFDLNGELDNV